jgi:tight adherence protein C
VTAVALVLGVLGWLHLPKPWAYGLIASGWFVVSPVLGVVVIAGFVILTRSRVFARSRDAAIKRRHDTLVGLDLVSLGTTAGLPFHAAVSLASAELDGALAEDLDRAVSRTNAGLDHALEDGPFARAFDTAQRSASTGARLGDSLVELAREVRADEAAAEREKIERLPVKLLFPLAFLILPGFILVAVVPSIVSGISQLSF